MFGLYYALKRLSSWKENIPGDFICVVVTSEYKVLRSGNAGNAGERRDRFLFHLMR